MWTTHSWLEGQHWFQSMQEHPKWGPIARYYNWTSWYHSWECPRCA